MNEAYKNALDQAHKDLADKVAEIKSSPLMAEILEIHQMLNGLESLLKEPKTSLGSLFNLTSEGEEMSIRVRFDDFVGLSPLEAGKKYLRKCQEARPFDEILAAIREGGARVDNEDEFRRSLTRSTMEIIKIGERYGALEKYPDIKAKRIAKARKQSKAGNDDSEFQESDEGREMP